MIIFSSKRKMILPNRFIKNLVQGADKNDVLMLYFSALVLINLKVFSYFRVKTQDFL